MSSIKNTAISGIMWSAVEKFSVNGTSFILSLILARLVTPTEYGLIAMLTIFIAISQVFIDSGFSNALIQRKECSDIDYSTVFYFNIGIAFICYGLLFFAAPFIAEFYSEPQLSIITRIVSLSLIINSFGVIQRTVFEKSLNFKTIAKIAFISVICSGTVGVTLAYLGYGVWALVVQNLANSIFNTLLFWIYSKWYPSLKYSWYSFRGLFSFGSKLLLSALLHSIYTNLYSLVIGRKYNPADVGYYNRACTLAQFSSVNLMVILLKVMYPLQCQIQDDEVQLANIFNKYLKIACLIIFPMPLILAGLAYPLIELVLTEKWLPSAPLLQILCFAYMFYPVLVINNSILNVRGRSDYFLRAEIIKKSIAIVILFATLPLGIIWLCIGWFLYTIIDALIIIYYSKKVINTGYIQQFVLLLPVLIISILTGLSAWSMTIIFESLWLQIIFGVIVSIFTYFALALCFKVEEINMLYVKLKSLLLK